MLHCTITHALARFQISDRIQLIGSKEGLDTLENEYVNDEIYLKKTRDLATKYDCLRRTRPDGNCFFRSFGYAYLEYLLDKKEEYGRLVNIRYSSFVF